MFENEPSFSLKILALLANEDSVNLPENRPDTSLPEAVASSQGDTKKRRLESFDELVDWCYRERSSSAWLTNSSDEREIFEIDVGNPLESEKSICRHSLVLLSKKLLEGNSTEVSYHRLLPGQQHQFDDAVTKELSQLQFDDAVRRLTHVEELNLKPERLLRMRWVLTWNNTEGGGSKAKTRLVIFLISPP